MAKAKKLYIITTGGTISQKRDKITGRSEDAGQTDGNVFAELLKDELDNHGYEVEVVEGTKEPKDSSNIVPEDWVSIIDTIVKYYDKADSFLITHGTNTLGYTSAALSFAFGNLGRRVVLTGSQVPHGSSGSDALMNLQNAARVAMTDEKELFGVVVVFGSKIITGARVKKRTEFDYDGFDSFSTTFPIGRVGSKLKFDENALKEHNDHYKLRARIADQLEVFKKFNSNIVSLTEFPGMSPKIFEALYDELKVEGFVFRAVGAGDPNIAPDNAAHTYTNLKEAFDFLQSRKIPIVVTTQSATGTSSMDINPSGITAHKMGAIEAWDMSMEAMTVKLMWLLGKGAKYEHIRGMMHSSVKGEVIVTNQ